MVDNTKYLNEFNPKKLNKKELKIKRFELLEMITGVEKQILLYISSLKTLPEHKKKDLEHCLLKKLRENFEIAIDCQEFIKGLDKEISDMYNAFISTFETTFKDLKINYGLDIIYKLDIVNKEANIKISNELNKVENDLFESFDSLLKFRLKIENVPLFLIYNYRNFISEKIIFDWESNYEIPIKRIKLQNNSLYLDLSKKFRLLVDGKFNLFDESFFSSEERFLLFEIIILSNINYIKESEYTKQVMYNNTKKYLYLFGLTNKVNKIMEMYSAYFDKEKDIEELGVIEARKIYESQNNISIERENSPVYFNSVFSKLDNQTNSNIQRNSMPHRNSYVNEILLSKINTLKESLKSDFSSTNSEFNIEKFSVIIFSYSIVLNNLMTFQIEDSDNKKIIFNSNDPNIKINFQPELKTNSREREFLINTLNSLDLFLDKPYEIKAKSINNLLEHYIFNTLIKSYTKNLFDENNSRKLIYEKEDLLDNISLEKDNHEIQIIQKDYLKFINEEVSFVKENNKISLKIANSVKSVFSFIGNKLGLTNHKTVIDITELKLIPYELLNTSTHVFIFIGGMFVGNKRINSNWKKLFPTDTTVDLYNFNWQSEQLYGLGYYLLDLLPQSYGITSKNCSNVKKLKKSLNSNILAALKESKVSVKNYKISEIYGKILAYFLAVKNVFNYHAVSLIGYSLGANVIKFCLLELYKMSDSNIDLTCLIQNIVFISGATHFPLNQHIDWGNVLEIVGGKIYNIYSEKDHILKIAFEKFIEEQPIGTQNLSILRGFKNIVQNVDMSKYDLNHFDYPDYFDKISLELDLA